MDPAHPKLRAGQPVRSSDPRLLRASWTARSAELLELVDDDTIVAGRLRPRRQGDGRRHLHERVADPGGIPALQEYPPEAVPLESCEIDWARTKAWGAGGYYGRLFLNVAGREPSGVIPPEDYEARDRSSLMEKLAAITDPDGVNIGTVAFQSRRSLPDDPRTFRRDLFVYFGDLDWRSVGTVGLQSDPHLRERHRPGRRQPRPGRHPRHL